MVAFTLALLFAARLADASKTFSMKMQRREDSSVIQRRAAVSVPIGNAILNGLYYVNASVGTPPQLVQLQIDTGSSDVWMFGPNSCDTTTSPCLGGECELIVSFRTLSVFLSCTSLFPV
jgi:hypothetical protein